MNANPYKLYKLGPIRLLILYHDVEQYKYSTVHILDMRIAINHFVWVDRELMIHLAWVLSPYLSKQKIEAIADFFGHCHYVCDWSDEDEADIPF